MIPSLIIHPNDPSTKFLNILYVNIQTDEPIYILNESSSSGNIRGELKLLKDDDILLLLGHGNPNGLFSRKNSNKDFDRLIINSRHVQFLRNTTVIGIWCYASSFAEKYNLHGLFSDMIISELDEAKMFRLDDYTNTDIELCMMYWVNDLNYCLNHYSLEEIPEKMIEMNRYPDDLLYKFNYSHLKFFK